MWGVLIDENRSLQPGALEVLKELKQSYKLGVATSISRRGMEEILEKWGISELFEAKSAGSDVAHNKPAPDVYLRSCELMGLEPKDCIVVEDTATYLTGIEAVGFKTVLMGPGGCDSLSELTNFLV